MQTESNSKEISIIIPAYNESARILPTLQETVSFFASKSSSFEIIVVDDGSSDETVECVQKFAASNSSVKIQELSQNTGKGAAIRSGVKAANGRLILYIDADGATPINEFIKLESAINSGADIAIGSRAMPSDDTRVNSNFHRKFLGRVFNFFANFLVIPNIKDTQCGFKLFKAEAAKIIFEKQTLNGFSFDVEVLYIAYKLKMKISEVAVNWNNKPGTKINVVLDGLKMLRDIFSIKLRHRSL